MVFVQFFGNQQAICYSFFFLTTYVENGHSLQDTNLFAIIGIFNTLTLPLGLIPWAINQLVMTRISYKRIINFLEIPEIDKNEILKLSYPSENELVIIVNNFQFEWPKKNDIQEDKDKKKLKKSAVFVENQQEKGQKHNFYIQIENLQIKKNNLYFIIGRIGSGKTALLNALLNELEKQQINIQRNESLALSSDEYQRLLTIGNNDQILIRGSISYVSQNPWVQNMNVRANILFGKKYNEDWYQKCIEASNLVKDLKSFKKLDMYELGPEGKNISGGQKQRITLCRALYQDSDIYLLDDIFSSLDVHVADQIFQKAVIELLIARGKTVLLVTSHYRYIQQYQQNSENIIYMDNGQIVKDEIEILSFLKAQLEKEKEEEKQEQEIQKLTEDDDDEKISLLPLLKQNTSLNYAAEDVIMKTNEEIYENIDDEQREEGEIDKSTLKEYFSSMKWPVLIIFLFFNFAQEFSLNLMDFWLKSQLQKEDSWLKNLGKYFNTDFYGTFLILIVFCLIVTFIRNMFYALCSLLSAWKMYVKLNKSILNSNMSFFDNTNQGKIINRVQNDTFVIDSELPWFLHVFLECLNNALALPIGIVILFPWLGLIMAFQIFLIFKLVSQFRKSNRDLRRLAQVNDGKLLTHLNESISGVKIIRALEKKEFFLAQYMKKLMRMTLAWNISSQCGFWLGVRLLTLTNLTCLCVFITIAVILFFNFEIDYANCGLALTYTILVAFAFNDTIKFFTNGEQRMISVERVRQYFKNPQEDIYKTSNKIDFMNVDTLQKCIGKDIKLVDKIPEDNEIIYLQNICLTYESNEDISKNKFALKDLTIKIKKNEKIAFVGRTGSGKTSIFNILFRLYDYQFGKIYINGKNSEQISLKELRSQMSVVPQFGFLFQGTIKDNLDPQGQHTNSEIEELFQKTGFTIKGMVIENENRNSVVKKYNLDFMIAQSGANLSNGEKQVINFFRTILQDKQIVCLDEATSNMDPKTDQELHKVLFQYAENKTLLVITHRLENIQKYDRIVVMEKGEIVEMGTYDELIKIQDGFFNRLIMQEQNK